MKYYITTPIYYVNDMPHIGHAYTTVAADVSARWQRLHGREVFFLTGTDEHGAKIAQAAAKNNQSPKAFCDGIVAGFKQAWESLDIVYDGFIRTTDERHEKTVQLFLQKLFDGGAIYKKNYEGLYCVPCEKFIAEADLNEDLCCPDHRQKPVHHSEENYFFRLSAYRDRLLEILSDENHPQHLAVYPVERRNEIIGKLRISLEDISISRAALEWGIPLPFDPDQTVYVWVDALLNYISAAGYGDDPAGFKQLWPADAHLMAKDILWFHSVIWPALLLAAGLPLPKKVFAHGFFTIGGQKMSKTLGNVIQPHQLIERFGVDASRYLVLSLFPFGTDGDISWEAMTDKYNVDLANNFGNLVSRTATMVGKYFDGKVPEPGSGANRLSVQDELGQAAQYFQTLEFSRAIEQIQKAIDRANRHIEASAPWKMAKENNPDLGGVMFDLLRSIGLIALYLLPFMPSVCRTVWSQIGETGPAEDAARALFDAPGSVPAFPRPGSPVTKGAILFPRIQTTPRGK